LSGFEYPVALVVEVTKQGVLLSKLRYLKALGDVINETIRCPSIEAYVHLGSHVDPYLINGNGKPTGIDWIFNFRMDRELFNETVAMLKSGEAKINLHNPKTKKIANNLFRKIRERDRVSFKRLDPVEQGLILEPYCNLLFHRAGNGERIVLQNVEVSNREACIRVRGPKEDVIYHPKSAPLMEIDLLVITEISSVHSVLTGLKEYGFVHERANY